VEFFPPLPALPLVQNHTRFTLYLSPRTPPFCWNEFPFRSLFQNLSTTSPLFVRNFRPGSFWVFRLLRSFHDFFFGVIPFVAPLARSLFNAVLVSIMIAVLFLLLEAFAWFRDLSSFLLPPLGSSFDPF